MQKLEKKLLESILKLKIQMKISLMNLNALDL